ncbi:efflux transporter outer membrane subunit [uncultured Brevundimonas sp.]|uniref:efflux transporter outer membrane subunit n=1 Tax=uncultured Brevundimonas sp. TaxID=213418 RepID=UPI0025E22A06|nr:efflux transporter outer membrane subunit [uncultured Brevundimonas sp.]
MSSTLRPRPSIRAAVLAFSLAAAGLTGCAVGPDFTPPTPSAPSDWTAWRSGDDSLHLPVEAQAALSPQWWLAFNDPVLDELQRRGAAASPDLETAALRFAQARLQRKAATADALPQVDASGQVSRQRQSEYGAGTRVADAIATGDRDALVGVLAEPFTLYQTGLDLSWELGLWGRVRRSLEAADADVAQQAALLDAARLALAGDLAQAYFQMRSVQRQIAIARADIALLEEETRLVSAQAQGGLSSHLPLERQRAELQRIQAQLPALMAQEAARASEIALLVGERPGALNDLLKPTGTTDTAALPTLALGLPSEVALRRPDVRAAEARLHRATASIGVARADLYPSIRLGAGFGFESYREENLFDWASRTTSFGPTVSLPLFDGGRRARVVQLRELEQKEAAVDYQKTVLQAWKEIDDALNAYAAEREQNERLAGRLASSQAAHALARARYEGGLSAYLDVIDAQRVLFQAERDKAESDGRLAVRFVATNRALGNG